MAGITGAAAAFSYHLPLMLAVVTGTYVLLKSRGASWIETLRRLLLTSGVTSCGFGLVLLIQKVQTNYWAALFMLDKRDKHFLQWPWRTLLDELQLAKLHDWRVAVPALQVIFISVAIWTMVGFALARRREWKSESALIIFAIVFWTAAAMWDVRASQWRTMGLLLPVSALQTYLPRWTSYLILIFMIAFVPFTAILFYRWKLV